MPDNRNESDPAPIVSSSGSIETQNSSVWPPPPSPGDTATTKPGPCYLSLKTMVPWAYILLVVSSCVDFLGLPYRNPSSVTIQMWIATGLNVLSKGGAFTLILIWTYRAYTNLKAFGATELTTTPAMAVGYHFIPILALFKPFMIYDEIARASDPRITETGRAARKRARTIPAIAIWWLTDMFSASTSILWGSHQYTYLITPAMLAIDDLVTNAAIAYIIYTITARQARKAATLLGDE